MSDEINFSNARHDGGNEEIVATRSSEIFSLLLLFPSRFVLFHFRLGKHSLRFPTITGYCQCRVSPLYARANNFVENVFKTLNDRCIKNIEALLFLSC